MSAKMGRPTDDPKTFQTKIRISENDLKMLDYCVEHTGKSRSAIIRDGIKAVYKRLKRQ